MIPIPGLPMFAPHWHGWKKHLGRWRWARRPGLTGIHKSPTPAISKRERARGKDHQHHQHQHHPSTRSVLQGRGVALTGYLFGRAGSEFGPSFCTVSEGSVTFSDARERVRSQFLYEGTMQFCAGGGYFFGRLARGFGASFCNLLEGNVRQWRRPCKEQVRPSGTCSFALTEATFLDAWQARPSGTCSFALAEATFLDACQMDLKLVFVSFRRQR